jgi:hypothetical protein
VSALNVINDGSGNVLNRFVRDFKNAIKQFCAIYKSRHYRDKAGKNYDLPSSFYHNPIPIQNMVGHKRNRDELEDVFSIIPPNNDDDIFMPYDEENYQDQSSHMMQMNPQQQIQ